MQVASISTVDQTSTFACHVCGHDFDSAALDPVDGFARDLATRLGSSKAMAVSDAQWTGVAMLLMHLEDIHDVDVGDADWELIAGSSAPAQL